MQINMHSSDLAGYKVVLEPIARLGRAQLNLAGVKDLG